MNYGPAAKYYDLFTSRDDIDFYRNLALTHGNKALELGVGTGRVAIELAKAGVTVWGIDNSKHMLSEASKKLKRQSSTVRNRLKLTIGDMRGFKTDTLYPLIYIASSTVEHCITEKDRKSCFRCAYESLDKKGILAFDLSQIKRGKPEASWWIERRKASQEKEIIRTIFSRRNPQTNIVSVNLFFEVYQEGLLIEKYYEYGEAHLSSKREIVEGLQQTGFEITNIFGDFDKSSYSKESPRIIFIAIKP